MHSVCNSQCLNSIKNWEKLSGVEIPVLFWVGWINLQLAIFNSLPINYMDGGYIFKDWINVIIERVTNTAKAERIAKLISWGMTLVLILSMLSVIIIPYVL